MATLQRLVGRLRDWADPLRACGPSDRQLLERFAAGRDEAAFAELVRRHGPMVLGVARRVLQNVHDAEDVFQATFLVLARKAGSVSWQDSIGGWLFPVVHHLALKVRTGRERRRTCEALVPAREAVEDRVAIHDDELRLILDEELDRLPDHYRSVLVLCYLEGRTQKEAAESLGLSPGEVRGRIDRARVKLRERLTRRGIALSAGAVAALTGPEVLAAMPPGTVETTTRAATLFAAGTTAGTASQAVPLARGVLNTMLTAKLKRLLFIVLALAVMTAGALSIPMPALGDDPGRAPEKKAEKEPASDKKGDGKPTKSVILLWMSGGPSQLDTFDLKPGQDNGGPFKEIDTAVKGIKISEHLPNLAKLTDRLAILRSVTHNEGDHNRAGTLMRVGRKVEDADVYPPFTSLLAKQLSDGKLAVPPYVSINPGFSTDGPGFLSDEFAALLVRDAAGPTLPALDEFKKLNKDKGESMRKGIEKAFDLKDEKKATRDVYAKTGFGKGCLLARRLVEAGVPVVEVTMGGWDTHTRNFDAVENLSKVLDPVWARLILDLEERKLLDSTLIVWMGEFGRTPKINANNGRDHWPRGFSVVLAGAGMKGGVVIGKTSDDGMKITEQPVTPAELHATIYRAVGIDPTKGIKLGKEEVPLVEKGAKEIKEALK